MTTRDEAYGGGARQYAPSASTTSASPGVARIAPSAGSHAGPGKAALRHPATAPVGVPPVGQGHPGGPAVGPSTGTAAAAQPRGVGGPRRVRLTVARVDPWSVMKLSFLLAVAVGIALVVSVGVLWTTLDSMGVFASVNSTIGSVLGESGTTFNLMDYIGFSRVLSLATVIAVVDVFLLTALATLGAFLYNMCSTLVGGLHVTLTDD